MSRHTLECLARTDFPYLVAIDPMRARCHLEALIADPEALVHYGEALEARAPLKGHPRRVRDWNTLRGLIIEKGICGSAIDDDTLVCLAEDHDLLVELQFDLFSANAPGPSWTWVFDESEEFDEGEEKEELKCPGEEQRGTISSGKGTAFGSDDSWVIETTPAPVTEDFPNPEIGPAGLVRTSIEEACSSLAKFSSSDWPSVIVGSRRQRDVSRARECKLFVIYINNASVEHAAPSASGDDYWSQLYIDVIPTMYLGQQKLHDECLGIFPRVNLHAKHWRRFSSGVAKWPCEMPRVQFWESCHIQSDLRHHSWISRPCCGPSEHPGLADPTRVNWLACVLDAALESPVIEDLCFQRSFAACHGQFIIEEESIPLDLATDHRLHGHHVRGSCGTQAARRIPSCSKGLTV